MNEIQRQVAAYAMQWPQWLRRADAPATREEAARQLQAGLEYLSRSDQMVGGYPWWSQLVLAWRLATQYAPDYPMYDGYRTLAPNQDMGPVNFTAGEEAVRLARGGRGIYWQDALYLPRMLP